jgi:hypothetical protein
MYDPRPAATIHVIKAATDIGSAPLVDDVLQTNRTTYATRERTKRTARDPGEAA